MDGRGFRAEGRGLRDRGSSLLGLGSAAGEASLRFAAATEPGVVGVCFEAGVEATSFDEDDDDESALLPAASAAEVEEEEGFEG